MRSSIPSAEAESKVARIAFRFLPSGRDETVRVECHRIRVPLRVVQQVPYVDHNECAFGDEIARMNVVLSELMRKACRRICLSEASQHKGRKR